MLITVETIPLGARGWSVRVHIVKRLKAFIHAAEERTNAACDRVNCFLSINVGKNMYVIELPK